MSLWKVAWRSIRQRALVSMLTIMSMGLGVTLVVAVLVVYGVISQSFHRGGEGYDLIIGAKGGKEQLVLNTVFYLSQPVGNIPYKFYEAVKDGTFGPVDAAVPVCMGHTYQGFRVVGTVPEMFTDLKYGKDQEYKFAEGENFKAKNPFDAVLGAVVALKTFKKVGDTFQAVHGTSEGGREHKESFKVVGILAPTGTPIDRAIFVNMQGFYNIHHHEEMEARGAHAARDGLDAEGGIENSEVTAVLVCVPRAQADQGQTDVLAKKINDRRFAQAVVPVKVITELFEGIVGKIQWILLGMAVVTVIEAGIGIMVSIYNSMSDRRHEIAIMRALGASRVTVMVIILMESILLSLMGGAFGVALGHGLTWLCSPLIVDWTGVVVGLFQFQPAELILIPGLVVLASAVGYLPALAAYRTDVAKSLITAP